jgi:hypothetical protein
MKIKRSGQAVSAAAAPRRGMRILWTALLVLALAFPAGVYTSAAVWTLTHKQPAVKTGDSLLDAYLQAALDNDALQVWGNVIFGSDQDRDTREIPETTWDRWEREFGPDPRFAMLCYYERLAWRGWENQGPEPVIPSECKYLEQARRSGSADWRGLLTPAGEDSTGWKYEARDTLRIERPTRTKTNALDFYAYVRKVRREADRRHGTEFNKLLTELEAKGADEAQVHYFLARIANERGEMDKVLRELQAGNASKHNAQATGFPFDISTRNRIVALDAQGDSLLGGYYALKLEALPVPDYMAIKDFVKEQAEWAQTHRDLARFQALHKYACDLGLAESSTGLDVLVAQMLDKIVLSSYEQAFPPGAGPTRRLSQARVLLAKIRSAVRSAGSGMQSSISANKPLLESVTELALMSVNKQYSSYEAALQYRDDMQAHDALRPQLAKDFAELRKLDLQPEP